jgi:hypothetical protein
MVWRSSVVVVLKNNSRRQHALLAGKECPSIVEEFILEFSIMATTTTTTSTSFVVVLVLVGY